MKKEMNKDKFIQIVVHPSGQIIGLTSNGDIYIQEFGINKDQMKSLGMGDKTPSVSYRPTGKWFKVEVNT